MAKGIKLFIYSVLSILVMLSVGLARNIIMLVKDVASPSATSVETFAAVQYQPIHMDEDIIPKSSFEVYVEGKMEHRFDTLEDAIAYASGFAKSVVREIGKSSWLWDNYPAYNVHLGSNDDAIEEFYTFHEAVAYARERVPASIFYRKNNSMVWSNAIPLSGQVKLDVAHISQFPELPRGCEVTSLAMLLQSGGILADKMALASDIKKDPNSYEIIGGKIYYGHPNDGFIGDMYNIDKPGLGVYHRPIHELLEKYLPDSALDLTGCDFEDLLYFLDKGIPVWVITNSSYNTLPAASFITWHTPSGEIQVTYREHSVLVTGYDDRMIYFNDPYARDASQGGKSGAPRNGFIQAWEQMGSQAVAYTP